MQFLEALKHPIFKKISKTADDLGQRAYVVGGFVRDYFLQKPSKDLDLVVIGSGIEFAEHLQKVLGEQDCTLAVFKNFGTAQIKFQDWIIEVIGARKESYRLDSRKPLVEDGTLIDDQNRRDFTINSMYLSLNSETFSELYDPFNGIQDLQDGIIRANNDPDITFSDDPLRMLRGIRFSARLNFKIQADTWSGIIKNAERIDIVSQERITDELNSMILGKKPSIAFDLMEQAGLLQRFFPEFVALKGIETIQGKSHKDNFYHTLQVLDQLCELSDDLWLRWAAILHDIAKPATKRFDQEVGWTFHGHEDRGSRMVKGIFRRMRLPLDEKMKFVEKMVAMHLRPIVLSKEIVTDSAVRRLIVEAGEDVGALMKLCRADITSKNAAKVQRHIFDLLKVEDKIAEVNAKDELRNWQPVVTGNHILERYQIDKPKHIGALKNEIREAILEGKVPNELIPCFDFLDEFAQTLGIARK